MSGSLAANEVENHNPPNEVIAGHTLALASHTVSLHRFPLNRAQIHATVNRGAISRSPQSNLAAFLGDRAAKNVPWTTRATWRRGQR